MLNSFSFGVILYINTFVEFFTRYCAAFFCFTTTSLSSRVYATLIDRPIETNFYWLDVANTNGNTFLNGIHTYLFFLPSKYSTKRIYSTPQTEVVEKLIRQLTVFQFFECRRAADDEICARRWQIKKEFSLFVQCIRAGWMTPGIKETFFIFFDVHLFDSDWWIVRIPVSTTRVYLELSENETF